MDFADLWIYKWQVIFDWSLHEQEHHKVIKLEMKSAYDSWREKGMVTRRLLDRLWEFGFEEPHLKAFLLRLGAGFSTWYMSNSLESLQMMVSNNFLEMICPIVG